MALEIGVEHSHVLETAIQALTVEPRMVRCDTIDQEDARLTGPYCEKRRQSRPHVTTNWQGRPKEMSVIAPLGQDGLDVH